jgi:hypothetical protein
MLKKNWKNKSLKKREKKEEEEANHSEFLKPVLISQTYNPWNPRLGLNQKA